MVEGEQAGQGRAVGEAATPYRPNDAQTAHHLARFVTLVRALSIAEIPNRKTDTNNHGPMSTDNIGKNYDYPEASYERRREILREHEHYQRGWLYFVAHDPRVQREGAAQAAFGPAVARQPHQAAPERGAPRGRCVHHQSPEAPPPPKSPPPPEL